ncbi:pentapeptide repeat-containing protein [Gillisia sp. JM1]|uniref:pentapeptide repeat-containing protein n=1 Tax=Gillisia sp. JM1 TaxID=1283286 RepID=UPI0004191E4D|nr:pentapeptide repeat-containing protein [Gillisia sp. JM1]
MQYQIIEEQEFNKIDYTETALPKGEYELCTFNGCNFTNSELSKIKFMECEFVGCNLSSVNIFGASFQEMKFEDCKMLGIRFDLCDGFGLALDFTNCQLDHSSFYQVILINSSFLNCKLKDIDLTEADLTKVTLDNCDLSGAIFERSNLEKANFSTAINYSINPENNKVKGASFSIPAVTGLLDKYKLKIANQ